MVSAEAAAVDQEDNRIKEKREELAAEAAVAAKVFLAVLVAMVELLVVAEAVEMDPLETKVKLVKVVVEDQERDRPLVLMVEKVVFKEMVQMMVVILSTVVEKVVPRALQFVSQVELHFH